MTNKPNLKGEFQANNYSLDKSKDKSKSAYERIIRGLSDREKERMSKHSR